jgi:hypothetical protein
MASSTTRSRQTAQTAQVEVSTADLRAGERIVRVSDRGWPEYSNEATPTVPLYTIPIADTAALPAAPTGVPTGKPADFDFSPFASVAVYWKNGTATHTSLTLTLWAYTSLKDWVIVDTATGVAPSTEVVLTGAGYRTIALQVTSPTGGATGSINLYLAGV